jgi:Holliday junction DNA helicase RuvA
MIGYLRGECLHIEANICLVLVQGIGYRVLLGARVAENKQVGDALEVWIETVVHEGKSTLFGFLTLREHRWFRWLMQVPGVGGKMAQAILSGFPPERLRVIILDQDQVQLKKIEGVGPKLALRILGELQDRAKKEGLSDVTDPLAGEWGSFKEQDALKALCALGYRKALAMEAVQQESALYPESSSEDLVRLSLRRLALGGH